MALIIEQIATELSYIKSLADTWWLKKKSAAAATWSNFYQMYIDTDGYLKKSTYSGTVSLIEPKEDSGADIPITVHPTDGLSVDPEVVWEALAGLTTIVTAVGDESGDYDVTGATGLSTGFGVGPVTIGSGEAAKLRWLLFIQAFYSTGANTTNRLMRVDIYRHSSIPSQGSAVAGTLVVGLGGGRVKNESDAVSTLSEASIGGSFIDDGASGTVYYYVAIRGTIAQITCRFRNNAGVGSLYQKMAVERVKL